MHGGSFKREVALRYYLVLLSQTESPRRSRVALRYYLALREQPFAYDGMLSGRQFPIEARGV
jgi:hypothetical protein